MIRFRVVIAVAALATVTPVAAQQNDVLFTSRLQGDYRLPDQQAFEVDPAITTQPCPVSGTARSRLSPDARAFMDAFKTRESNAVLVGTGDNFAPNYLARTFAHEASGSRSEAGGKSEYYWNAALPGWVHYEELDEPANHAVRRQVQFGTAAIGTDNVGCFLAYAHYAAIVPGKNDFYFGAERLRQLSRFLAGIKQDGYRPVQMLAANLVIQTVSLSDGEPPAAAEPRGGFPHFRTSFAAADPRQTIAIEDVTAGGAAFPWMREVTITTSGFSAGDIRPVLCTAEAANPDHFMEGADRCRDQQSFGAATSERADGDSGTRTMAFRLPAAVTQLEPGGNYAVCVPNPDRTFADQRWYCSRFTVHQPFLQYQRTDAPLAPASCGAFPSARPEAYQNPKPYVTIDRPDRPVAIFGVVDPRLRDHVGVLNGGWRVIGEDGMPVSGYKTEIAGVDPAKTLVQLQQCFDEEHRAEQRPWLRVLLAQMTPADAALLQARLPEPMRFDVIITEADDAFATPDQEVTMKPALPQGDGTALRRPGFVVTSPLLEDAIKGRLLTVSISASEWRYTVRGGPVRGSEEPGPAPLSSDPFWRAMRTALTTATGLTFREDWTAADRRRAFQQLVLHAMQKRRNADVALLQERDFFHDGLDEYLRDHRARPAPLDVQEILDLILWKGDFLNTRVVQGSVLQRVLDQSAAFANSDPSASSLVSAASRALVTLGVHKDPVRGEYVVNGVPVDPSALYLVAATDYIDLGDTGYPELAQRVVGPPRDPFSDERVYPITAVVCQSLERAIPNPEGVRFDCDDESMSTHNYFDQLARVGPGEPTGGTVGEASSTVDAATQLQRKLLDPAFALDRTVQNRRTWLFSLEELGVGYTQVATNAGNRFGGVSEPQTAAQSSAAIDFDVKSRFSWLGARAQPFVSQAIHYSSINSGDGLPANQTRNAVVFEAGNYVHLPAGKAVPRLKWFVLGHLENQLVSPRSQVTVTPDAAPATDLHFDLSRDPLLLGRSGLRLQGRTSFVEAGYQLGAEFAPVRGFRVLSADGADLAACVPSSDRSLAGCLNELANERPSTPFPGDTRIQVERGQARRRSGMFWNTTLDIPFIPRLSYTLENAGDFFLTRAGDTSADTRYRNTMVHTLKLQVFPSLSFEPTYTIFLYSNKLENLRLVQQQLVFKASLSFDWSHGSDKAQQAGYKKSGS